MLQTLQFTYVTKITIFPTQTFFDRLKSKHYDDKL